MPKKSKKKNRAANITEYTTGTGQKLWRVHSSDKCAGEHCVIHNPSNHSMREFPTHWRSDRGLMERICSHGVGHPDPDDPKVKLPGEGIHGCDGCCTVSNNTLRIPFDDGSSAWERGEDFFDSFFNRNKTKPTRSSLLDDLFDARLVKQDPAWVDQNAEPNGIGSVCVECHRLIDHHPFDHALGCAWQVTTPCVRWEGKHRPSDDRPCNEHGEYVYRVMWEEEFGNLPPVLHHMCKNGWCINLDHLKPFKSNAEHMREHGLTGGDWGQAEKTHCPNGHEYSDENTYNPPATPNERLCRVCRLAAKKRFRGMGFEESIKYAEIYYGLRIGE